MGVVIGLAHIAFGQHEIAILIGGQYQGVIEHDVLVRHRLGGVEPTTAFENRPTVLAVTAVASNALMCPAGGIIRRDKGRAQRGKFRTGGGRIYRSIFHGHSLAIGIKVRAILAHAHPPIALHSYLALFRGCGCTHASIRRQPGARLRMTEPSRLVATRPQPSRHSLCNRLLSSCFCPHKNIEFLEIAP